MDGDKGTFLFTSCKAWSEVIFASPVTLSRNVLATLWRDKLRETFHIVKYPATTKIVARQVARKVELNSTFGNGSCNLSRSDFGRCRVCYTEMSRFRATWPAIMLPKHCETSCTKHFTV